MARTMNGHLSSAREGSDEKIVFDISDHTPVTGFSGHVDEGIYEVTCKGAELTISKTGAPLVKLTWMTSGPEGYQGIRLMDWRKVPVGDPDSDPEVKTAKRMFDAMMASIADAKGVYEEVKKGGAASRKVSWFVGQRAHVQVVDDMTDRGNLVSKIQFYVMKQEFTDQPGPFGRAASTASETTSAKSNGNGRSTSAGAGAAKELLGSGADDTPPPDDNDAPGYDF